MKSGDTLGIDLGNTIIRKGKVIPGAYETIRALRDRRFGSRIRIVSRVNEEQEIRARAFVTSEEFQRELAIPMGRIHFCRERHEKGPICERLEVDIFIDDRVSVMIHMPPRVRTKILFDPTDEELQAHEGRLSGMWIARSWDEVCTFLLENPIDL